MKEHERGRREDPERKAPKTAEEQDAPEPERPRKPVEEAGQAPHQVEDPPQAEGDRD